VAGRFSRRRPSWQAPNHAVANQRPRNGPRIVPPPLGCGATSPYMFSSMVEISRLSFLRPPLGHLGEPPLGGLWNEGERSEPSGTTRPAAAPRPANRPGEPASLSAFKGWLFVRFSFSLPPQGPATDTSLQGVWVAGVSSYSPWTACGLSENQLEPRQPSVANSNRCWSGGSARQFVCIRLSDLTLARL